MTAVRLRNVSKSFGSHRAVDGLQLAIPKGSIFGFIGPCSATVTPVQRRQLHLCIDSAVVGRHL